MGYVYPGFVTKPLKAALWSTGALENKKDVELLQLGFQARIRKEGTEDEYEVVPVVGRVFYENGKLKTYYEQPDGKNIEIKSSTSEEELTEENLEEEVEDLEYMFVENSFFEDDWILETVTLDVRCWVKR